MSQIRILTDSTSDVPPELAAELRITVVPAYIQIGNRSFPDGPVSGGLSREQFYAQLPAMAAVPTTAVPPAYEFATAYHRLAGEADEVIAIVISSNLSGMYNAAYLGAQEVPRLKIHIVDSGQVTMGLGWMVIAAAEAAAAGKSAQDILALMEDMKPRVHVFAMLDTLEYLHRSGRVGWARAKAAQILRVKPIVEVILGKVQDIGRTRTRHRAIDRLVELTRALGPLERLSVLHTYAPELDSLRDRLAEVGRSTSVGSPGHLFTVAATTIIGAHVGPRGLGVAAVTAR
jgi:DegV family protein with EDD domain